MKYDIYLLPHLQEMEGMARHCGEIEAPDKASAMELAVKTFGQGGYFSAFDFDVRPKEVAQDPTQST